MEASLTWLFDFYKIVPRPGKTSKRISILKCLDKNKNELTLQHELAAAQNLNVTIAFIRLFVLLHKQNRKINIIEIGTFTGGLTVILDTFARRYDLDYKLYTYDIVDRVSKNTKQLFCDLDINLEIVDVFSELGLTKLVNVTNSDAMTVIFCDGGNKAREISIFSDLLRVGDVILGHDYGYDAESFKDKAWTAHELDFNMIKNTYQQHNLRFVFQKLMEDAVWFCARKTTDVGKNLQILTVCNEPYRPMMTELLVTLEIFHPEVPVKMLALNLTKESKEHFGKIHSNIDFIDDSYSNFENFEEERAYCESCRTWNMKQLLTDTKSDIFYLDGDVYLKGGLFELFDFFSTVDFCARIKIENPIRFNAGMIYVKNTDENIKIVQQWEDQTRKHGWVWLSAQNELGNVLEEHLASVTVKTLPEKFDGIDTNEKSVIVHRKGPKDLNQ